MDKNFLYLSTVIGKKDVEILRCGMLQDRKLKITPQILQDLVTNFDAQVYGTEVAVNLKHETGAEAAGWIQSLYIDGDRLMARVEWTKLGQEKIEDKIFKFVSVEFSWKYPHFQTGKLHSHVLTGLALTNSPALKGQEPLMLSEFLQNIHHNHNHKNMNMFEKMLEKLSSKEDVTMAEFTMLEEMLAAIPPEEKPEGENPFEKKMSALKDKAAKYEAKAAEAQKKMKELEEEADKAKKAKMAEEKAANEKLSETEKEKVALQERVEKLEAEANAIKLEAKVKEKMLLSETNKVGFVANDLEQVKAFMAELTEAQQDAFIELSSKVRGVQLGEVGTAGTDGDEDNAGGGDDSADKDKDKAEALAEKFMSQDKELTKFNALAMAWAKLGVAKL